MKKVKLMLIIAVVMSSLMGCGGNNEVKESAKQSVTDTKQETIAKESREDKEEVKKEEDANDKLVNWVGVEDHFGATVIEDDGSVNSVDIQISYPSLKPASSGCAYQWDPALVLVTTPDMTEDLKYIRVENLKDTFKGSKESIIMYIDWYRSYGYSDFDFIVESQEALTINNLETYKYTGKHTYTLDGESQEIPFVAYSFDTKQVDNIYLTVIVMDDSINNPSMEPLPEGTIEAYALKMIESVVVIDDIF